MAAQRTILTIPEELKARIRDFRFAERIDTEAEAIRRLITEALDARGVKAEPRRGAAEPAS
ncbi:hypothetical protein ACQVP2_29585 [Methylobacterium aquaticum]|uniref:hypothetical protein n=1 Tax=Methylobacterium aquaticum TaxID=270351 RepID=UPI003D182784